MNESTKNDLRRTLRDIEGAPCAEYRRLKGAYRFDLFTLRVEYVPEQPDFHPCRIRVAVPLSTAKFPRDVFTPKSREIAARDFLARQFAAHAGTHSVRRRGMSGGSFGIERPGQQIIETNAVVLGDDLLEVRCTLDLPVIRKRIPGEIPVDLFLKRLSELIRRSLTYEGVDRQSLVRWLETNEDADTARGMLDERGLVAFIADGSLLAFKGPHDRRSVVPFTTPAERAVTLTLPNRGETTGMGIPKGITVIAGGWHQGKTTLLRAIGFGVYNHIPGDGRELAVTVPDAVVIRTEEGRRVERIDLSPLLPPYPGTKTAPFSTGYASPAISMAANIMEALEIGTKLLLFDDETSALPLVSRDSASRELLPATHRPPHTLTDILPLLRDEHGISSVVVGSSEELLDIADTVILLNRFVPHDVTARAKEITANRCTAPSETSPGRFILPPARTPLSRNLEPPKADRKKPQPPGRDIIPYGDEYLDLSGLPQLVSKAQARAIGRAIALVDRLLDGSPTLRDAIEKVMVRISTVGLDTLSNRLMGDLASFRPQELAAAINRMRQLRIK